MPVVPSVSGSTYAKHLFVYFVAPRMPFAPGEQPVEKHWGELKVVSQPEVVGSLLPNPVSPVVVTEQRQVE